MPRLSEFMKKFVYLAAIHQMDAACLHILSGRVDEMGDLSMELPLQGVYCAAATPLTANGDADIPKLAEHCQRLLADGCDGVAVLGTTGEANSFARDERMAILDGLLAAGIAPETVLPGTGAASLRDAQALTRHATEAGVRGVLVLPPFYYKPVSDEGLAAFYGSVIEGLKGRAVSMLLYHIPHISGVPITHSLISLLRDRFPEVVVGLKDSSGDRDGLHAYIKGFEGFSVFAGADPLMREALSVGGAGCITAASNLIAPELRTIYDGPSTAAADAAQERIIALRELSLSAPQIPAIRTMIAARTGDAAWVEPRPPLLALGAEDRDRVAKLYSALSADR